MSKSKPQRSSRTFREGGYLYFNQCKYRINSTQNAGTLLVATNLLSSTPETLALMDVLNADYIYADSLLELSTKIDHSESTFIAPPEGTMPKKFRDLAKRKIAIVEAVEALANQTIVGLEREGQHVNQTSVLRDAAEKSHISLATYYNYKNVVQKHKTVDAIAASMRRNTYGKTHRTKTQEALLIALLNNYSTLAGADLIKIQDDVLMRTGNLWIDPSKCDNQVPADLTSELLNPTIKMEDILANPDKRKLLEPLKRVSSCRRARPAPCGCPSRCRCR